MVLRVPQCRALPEAPRCQGSAIREEGDRIGVTIGSFELDIGEFVRRIPFGDFRAPANRNAMQAQPVIHLCSNFHFNR
ncbi:MAG: hypothetical protein MUC94_06975 [bacterium]|nr:hypothetical protein [bacterium]